MVTRQNAPGASGTGRTRTSSDISTFAPPNIKLAGPQADELESIIRHYDALLEARDNHIMTLTSQLESEQRRASMLESELGLALAASSRAEAAHAGELAKVEGDVARVLAERRGLLEKLAGIEVVEDAVREMVVQMKFRIGDDEPPSPEQLQAEKETLRDENILAALGGLKATLVTLWNFKVEAEEDMRCSRNGRAAQHASALLALKARVREVEGQVRQAEQERQEAEARAAAEAAAREALMSESRAALSDMEASQGALLTALKAASEEAAAARRALAAAQEEGRRRDGLVLKNQQLGSARHFDRVAQDRELRIMQAAHTRQLSAVQCELGRLSDLLMRNQMLAGQLRAAEADREALRVQLRAAGAAVEMSERKLRCIHGGNLSSSHILASRPSFLRSSSPAPLSVGAPSGAGVTANSAMSSKASTGRITSASGRPGLSSALQLLASRKAERAEQARAEAEVLESKDPVYQTLVNVNKLHRGMRNKLKEVKRDLAEAAPSWARPRRLEQPTGRVTIAESHAHTSLVGNSTNGGTALS